MGGLIYIFELETTHKQTKWALELQKHKPTQEIGTNANLAHSTTNTQMLKWRGIELTKTFLKHKNHHYHIIMKCRLRIEGKV